METSRIAKDAGGPKIEKHREQSGKYSFGTKRSGILTSRNSDGPRVDSYIPKTVEFAIACQSFT